MGLAKCIASAACGICSHNKTEDDWCNFSLPNAIQAISALRCLPQSDNPEILDFLRLVIESSKQHFGANYRLRVCENILDAATSLVCTFSISFEALAHFISAFPREFTDHCGFLRVKVQEWLLGFGMEHTCVNSRTRLQLLNNLFDFPHNFIRHQYNAGASGYDNEDLNSWESEATRWARVLFLVINEEDDLSPLLMFLWNHGTTICNQNKCSDWEPLKFLILISSLVQEIQFVQEAVTDGCMEDKPKAECELPGIFNRLCQIKLGVLIDKFVGCFISILEHMVSFASMFCSIFWSRNQTDDAILLPSAGTKHREPTLHQLSSSTAIGVLKATTLMKTVASVSSCCAQFRCDGSLNMTFTFMWKFSWNIILSPACDSEVAAEDFVAAYEVLAAVVQALVFASPLALDLFRDSKGSSPEIEGKTMLGDLIQSFLQNINSFLTGRILPQIQRAILLNKKAFCLQCLLSIPDRALMTGVRFEDNIYSISETVANCIYYDLVESLKNAGEGAALPILRSVRLVLGLFASGRLHAAVSSCVRINTEMIWLLARASISHVSCRKQRAAPVAAVLSSVLHPSIFGDENMHGSIESPGPLKWFVEKLLEESTKSRRTVRLAALHLTGKWLLNPKIIKYYVKELKLLSLHGSVAVDDNFGAEIAENHDARVEVLLLGRSPDPELTAAFINTELYARISVAVLFYRLADLADMAEPKIDSDTKHAAREAGQLLLLELLNSVVNDNDLSKELYKRHSGIHRRKVRAWQMICILSHFVDRDILEQVSKSLHICLDRNNLPGVRQYLETFAVHVFLKFPLLAKEQLVPILRGYSVKAQALSSYVFIAANVILHSPETCQYNNLDELLPPIIPLLSSHHHSLRRYTQVLVYQVLCKLFPAASLYESMPLERRCFEDLKLYLAENSDCMRLRASMKGYLDEYDPRTATTPAGIFSDRIEELEFECVPTCLMEEVIALLNDAREDHRCSMAKDRLVLKNESLMTDEDLKCGETLDDANKNHSLSLDYQKKASPFEHLGDSRTYKQFIEIEREDELLEQLLQSSNSSLEKRRAGRQPFILVASLLDRIPNLAGLTRTCEIFNVAGLAFADTNVLHDKQFELISRTAEKFVPIEEVPVNSIKLFVEKKKREGFSILGLEQTANSVSLDQYIFPKKTVLVLGHEKEGIPADLINFLDACIEIPQLGLVKSLNVHVSGSIALWEYTRQQRFNSPST